MLAHVLEGRCPLPHLARRSDGHSCCEDAAKRPGSKNARRNVSLLVRFRPADGGACTHLMVDAGKTMREGAIALLPGLGVSSIDALLLTHAHADAMLGLDDLRDLQARRPNTERASERATDQPPTA